MGNFFFGENAYDSGKNRQKFQLVNQRGFENKSFCNFYTGFIRQENCKHLAKFFFSGKKVTAVPAPSKVRRWPYTYGWVGATHYSGLSMLGGST